jgi:hypothetical protein
LDRTVGSSAIIVTIEESYMPYDVAVKDMRLWSLLPTSTHPFCIRSHGDAVNSLSLWEEFDQGLAVHQQEEAQVEAEVAIAYCGSADCLLDEWVWKVETWVSEHSTFWTEMEPRCIGRRLAWLTSGRKHLVSSAAEALATRWPEVEAPKPVSPAGEALLARAGAIAAEVVAAVENVAVEAVARSDDLPAAEIAAVAETTLR